MNPYNFDYEKAQKEENESKPKKSAGEVILTVLQVLLSIIMAIAHA
ncbi:MULTISPECIES: hypothetical protein [Chryseobacterium]|uniref:Uncharacterized protein n=1 Tax=Chryseobacterium camelliae TaxID=1265445 RepID=A0ABU0TIT2_9FLAO|nr:MULTISPECIES: hypothetical protein [Chryseobacterium]MDT3409183.1 hypothetical protein [Pseudacidovorax intermedius]MDQ1096956.1 hypothetical protein [Chryseobacterium camelliae]MDQ1100897.1 hypothetical protein [Chryseobacterium sp. SORGH_AS_1048]MDR6084340.1 hypothetical protein [Chryseobacterium sp. SORGH_AS_0909]MDR6132611.1 hypothetical protein [Chryseobacterium sp. SORGH_AS_1175]